MTNISILKPKGYEEWRPVPDWCRWTAVDSDGSVGAFEDKPHVASRQWVADHGRFAVLGINPGMRSLWEKSLTPVHGVKVPTSRSFADGKARKQLRTVIGIVSALLLLVIVVILSGCNKVLPFGERECHARWAGSGFKSSFDPFGGCRIQLKSGRWIPEEHYRFEPDREIAR